MPLLSHSPETMKHLLSRTSSLVALPALAIQLLISTPAPVCAASGEAEFLSQVRQLTFEGKRSGEGYFSPDGKSLIFQSERDLGNPF